MASYRAYASIVADPGAVSDPSAVTLGMEFRTTASTATVTQLWFYYSTTGTPDASTRTLGLYDSTGTLLASGAVTVPGVSGWVNYDLPTPVTIHSGTEYRAVAYHPNGGYCATANWYSSGAGATDLVNGILTVPNAADSTIGGAGLQNSFIYATGIANPTGSFNASFYYIDVTVTTASVTSVPATGAGASRPPSINATNFVSGGGPGIGTGVFRPPVVGINGGTGLAIKANGTGTARAPVVSGIQSPTVNAVRAIGVGVSPRRSGHAEFTDVTGRTGVVGNGHAEFTDVTGLVGAVSTIGHAEFTRITGFSVIPGTLQSRPGLPVTVSSVTPVTLDGSGSTGAWVTATWTVASDTRVAIPGKPYVLDLTPLTFTPGANTSIISIVFPPYPETYTVVMRLTISDGVTQSIATVAVTVWAWVYWKASGATMIPRIRYRLV